ncbi:hypothetical protein [Saccharospirillum alexandrii]|uniref:hypothetical protein n=1 Tax=Saccharospirillum alexandrii TaxID=2448477 RepID=UPI000FD930ED|nr:hypothetical protein [Saccharospirillum alexandrii]
MKILIMTIVLLLSFSAEAESIERGAIPFEAEGTVITTSPVREAPPHGLFNLFVGQQIESTRQNSTVKIIGKKTYGGFSGTNVWYQVESVNDLTATEDRPLWIYGGVEGEAQQIQINRTE